MTTEKFVPIYSTAGLNNALLIKGLLNSFHISAHTSQESVGVTMGLTLGTLGEAWVYVPQSQVNQARAIIHAYENNEFDQPEDPENLLDSPDSN